MAESGDSGAVVQELVSDGKSHGPSWLIGHHVKSTKVSGNAPTSTYIEELTTRIRQDLVDVVEANVSRKVQDEVDTKVNQNF
ncbi:hypothetical protein OROMI_006067 [Orobanche minor]